MEDGLLGINGLGVGTTCEDAVCEDIGEMEWRHTIDDKGRYFVDDVNGWMVRSKLGQNG